ncbi:hypothetical protein V473_18045 [Sphingobium cupriresistens LL01]|uniref:Uncharacterized protein n=1 Tax=Sphingobium cupriresistens LL01 TaxID=1420583 RepID=A0A0J7XQJ8_9SPHN|nr:hypothetical protein V473_18045 [Sphingobium cupriresistens LL01]
MAATIGRGNAPVRDGEIFKAGSVRPNRPFHMFLSCSMVAR